MKDLKKEIAELKKQLAAAKAERRAMNAEVKANLPRLPDGRVSFDKGKRPGKARKADCRWCGPSRAQGLTDVGALCMLKQALNTHGIKELDHRAMGVIFSAIDAGADCPGCSKDWLLSLADIYKAQPPERKMSLSDGGRAYRQLLLEVERGDLDALRMAHAERGRK